MNSKFVWASMPRNGTDSYKVQTDLHVNVITECDLVLKQHHRQKQEELEVGQQAQHRGCDDGKKMKLRRTYCCF